MQRNKLARVRWRVGQTLLPVHFQTQEQALAAEARVRAGLSGLPQFGIASLELNQDMLEAGTFSIESMTAVMRNGLLLDVPGNATVESYPLEEADKTEVVLYLHERQWEPEDEDEPVPASGVPLQVHKLFVSPDQLKENATVLLRLGKVTQTDKGTWQLSPKDAPPLLQVGSNPFLEPLLRDTLDVLLSRAQNELRTFLGDSQSKRLRSEQLTNARRAYCEVCSLQAMRAEMDPEVGIYPHPHVLFEALRRFYFEICCYRQMEPDTRKMPVYRHEKPGQTLIDWLSLFEFNFRAQGPLKNTWKAFERHDSRFVIELGRKEGVSPESHDFYLLVNRKEPREPRSLEKVKLASADRLGDVRRLALKGITILPPAAPGFAHDMPLDYDWHLLRTDGEEWTRAWSTSGLSLALYATPAVEDAELRLFWRGK